MTKTKEKTEKDGYKYKSHHKKRAYRLSDENDAWLKSIKQGTWNNTFNKLRKNTNI